MYVIGVIFVFVFVFGVLGKILFDSAFWGAVIGLVLAFASLFLFMFMPSKKEVKKFISRKKEDNENLQSQWDNPKWMKENSTNAYKNRKALEYFSEIIDNPSYFKLVVILCWVFCGLFALMTVFSIPMIDAYDAIYPVFIGLAGFAICGGLAIYMKKTYARKYVRWLKAVNYNFLKECSKENIRTLNSREEIARLKMICEKIGMEGSEEELIRRFNNAKQERIERQRVLSNRSNEDRIDRSLERDEQEVENITKHLSLIGREKMIYLCQEHAKKYRDKAEEYSNELRALNSKCENARRNFSQQEHDWAVHGGIASAIAGPAAGVATALDIQAKNAKIKEHNKEVTATVAATYIDESTAIISKITEAEKEVEKWENRAKEAQNKLVEELPEIQLMELLNPTVVGMTYNSAGTLRIAVEVQSAKPMIYDKVVASVDGYIRAVLKKEGISIGEAILMLPYNGSYRSQKLTGICINAPIKSDIDSVEFEPIKLWAIER